MESTSTPAVTMAAILAILVLAFCFLFVMDICSFLSATIAMIITWPSEKGKRRPPAAVSSSLADLFSSESVFMLRVSCRNH